MMATIGMNGGDSATAKNLMVLLASYLPWQVCCSPRAAPALSDCVVLPFWELSHLGDATATGTAEGCGEDFH